jgi:hypothetical protein
MQKTSRRTPALLPRFNRTRLILALSAAALASGAAMANDIQSFQTVYNTDWASAGVGGMRDNGVGTISLSGVSGTVTKAYLYWHGPSNSTDPTANSAVTVNGNNVSGLNIGFSSDNCWGFQNSAAYRADVTSLVSGDGSYNLSGFIKDSGNINVNGASLIVFFDDGNSSNNRDVVMFDGNDSNISNSYDADGWNVNLNGINYTSGSANVQLHVSDGQTFNDDSLILNGNTLVSAGPIFQGTSVPGPNLPAGNGNLWDIKTYDITSALSPGNNNLHLTTGAFEDCLSLVVATIDLPAGAAPTPVPEVSTIVSAFGFLGLFGSYLVRRVRK